MKIKNPLCLARPLAIGKVILVTSTLRTYYLSYALSMSTSSTLRVIDSHLHVWANRKDAAHGFPYVQAPPEGLEDRASTDELLKHMAENGVHGALIVQPINHKFDHSYVIQAIKSYPDKLKGIMLHDPTLTESEALQRLEDLALQGFVGVRFNPYLWPEVISDSVTVGESKKNTSSRPSGVIPRSWAPMSQGAGLAVYRRCAELNMPIGIMCFQGLSLHYNDIINLIQNSPNTMLVLDHFGFATLEMDSSSPLSQQTSAFEQLLQLSSYPNVYVKISALSRLQDQYPYERVRTERFLPLLKAFGSDRLLYGSDFPFALNQPELYSAHQLVSGWIPDDKDRYAIMAGTCERLFGYWGVSIVQ